MEPVSFFVIVAFAVVAQLVTRAYRVARMRKKQAVPDTPWMISKRNIRAMEIESGIEPSPIWKGEPSPDRVVAKLLPKAPRKQAVDTEPIEWLQRAVDAGQMTYDGSRTSDLVKNLWDKEVAFNSGARLEFSVEQIQNMSLDEYKKIRTELVKSQQREKRRSNEIERMTALTYAGVLSAESACRTCEEPELHPTPLPDGLHTDLHG